MKTGSLNGFSASFDDRVLMQRLRWMGDRALPDTVAQSLNETADAITARSKHNVRRELTVRTKFTMNSIKTKNRARGRNVDRMFARTGTISKYLPLQNVGGTVRARSRSVPIPTVAARTGKSYQRSVAQRYRMNKIPKTSASNAFFMGRGGRSGDYGIWQRTRTGVRLVRRLGHRSVDVPATNWFDDAIDRNARLSGARFRRAAQRRLRGMR